VTRFEARVARIVRRIPRAVGTALSRGLGGPAHRVVTADGRLVAKWPEQSVLLRREGVVVRDGRIVRPIPWWRR
jgi:alkylated DNA nucleotide flippase Atl1